MKRGIISFVPDPRHQLQHNASNNTPQRVSINNSCTKASEITFTLKFMTISIAITFPRAQVKTPSRSALVQLPGTTTSTRQPLNLANASGESKHVDVSLG
jgi:hypothetical protein